MYYISEMDLVNFRIDGLVSESGPEQKPGKNCKSLKSWSKVPELIEEY